MNQWRDDAQPEWPEVVSTTREFPANNSGGDRRVTQVFPEGAGVTGDGGLTGGRGISGDGGLTGGGGISGDRGFSADRGISRSLIRRPGTPHAVEDAARTEVLPGGSRSTAEMAEMAEGAAPTGPGERTVLRDPWQQDDGTEHTHDPHEVTVQLDAVQIGDGFVRQAARGPGGGHNSPSDGPVFVDESGRRSRRFRRIGMAVGLACAVYAVVIVTTLLSGNSNAPWLPVPGQQEGLPAGQQVDTSPAPAESARPTDTGTPSPDPTPTAGDVTAPSPGNSATAPGTVTSPDRPGTSAGPSPAPTPTDRNPGTGVADPAPTRTTGPPAPSSPDPTPTGGTSPDPTGSAGADDSGGTGTGTETVADGPKPSQPVAESPAEQQGPPSSPAPSPEYVL